MKILRMIVVLYVVFSVTTVAASLHVYLLDFNKCMNCVNSKNYKIKFKWGSEFNKVMIQKLEELYNKNYFSKIQRSAIPKIPKTIHQIWVGPNPLPDVCKKMGNIWQKFNPSWQYKLWTNDNINEILLGMSQEHRDMFENAEELRGKANFLRYYILYKHGGLYVDMDSLCLASFDELNHYYDFYVGISHNNTRIEEILNNATIASAPGHPIMKYVIDNIKKDTTKQWCYVHGVLYFTKAVLDVLFEAPGVNIAFPSNVFYPYKLNKYDDSLNFLKNSMCMHYWASWSNPNWELNKW